MPKKKQAANEPQVPGLVKMNQLQEVYKHLWEDDETGSPVELKMQATADFKERFNLFVYEALLECVNHARADGRKTLTVEDVLLPSEAAGEEEP